MSASAWRCGHGALIGDAVGGGAAGGEVFDEGADQAAVLGIQPAFQADAAVAAIP
jgi:hypothetical protein